MKMPTRPWFPPMEARPDIFGLHHVTILAAACESDAERKERMAKVEAGVVAAFKAAVHHLGEDQARQLFRRVLQRPKRGQGKAHVPDRDARLLKAYDEAVQTGESIAALARRLRAEGTELGNTAPAIQTHIRKLVKQRKQRVRAAAFEARRWRMATRNDPPTLASGAGSREK